MSNMIAPLPMYQQPVRIFQPSSGSFLRLTGRIKVDNADYYYTDADLSSMVEGIEEPVIEKRFEPYVRSFEQRWNTFLSDNTRLFADVFVLPSDGMLGIMFYIVSRADVMTRMQIIPDSFRKMSIRNSKVNFVNIILGIPFFDVLEDAVLVVKPDMQSYWRESCGVTDADDTIAIHFSKTMPEKWKALFNTL